MMTGSQRIPQLAPWPNSDTLSSTRPRLMSIWKTAPPTFAAGNISKGKTTFFTKLGLPTMIADEIASTSAKN